MNAQDYVDKIKRLIREFAVDPNISKGDTDAGLTDILEFVEDEIEAITPDPLENEPGGYDYEEYDDYDPEENEEK